MALLSFLGGIVKPVTELIDNLHTSVEEKLAMKVALTKLETEFGAKALDYEKSLLTARAEVINTETKSESTITRTWRPVTMLTFLGIVVWFVVGKAFGLPLPEEAFVNNVFGLIKLGLGGYVLGRSAEKVVPAVMKALKKKENV